MTRGGLELQWLHVLRTMLGILVVTVVLCHAQSDGDWDMNGDDEATTTSMNRSYILYPDVESDRHVVIAYTDIVHRNSSSQVVLYDSLNGRRVVSGSQENFGPADYTHQDFFPMGLASEFYLGVVAMHMNRRGLLPFSKDGLLPRNVLPPALQDSDILVNPRHPGVPISLDHLLQHLSGINEVGFEEAIELVPISKYTSVDHIEVPTLEEYVENVFLDYPDDIWRDVTPGTSTSFYFSRNNIALATYVLNRILQNNTRTKNTTPNVSTYLLSTVLPPLGARSTFFLNRKGEFPSLSYPEGMRKFNMLQYQAVQRIWSNNSVVGSAPIHPVYTADFMLYTTADDLFTMIKAVMNDGYFGEEGNELRANPVNINPQLDFADPVQQHVTALRQRSVGLFGFNIHSLCLLSYSDCNTTVPLNNVTSFGVIAANDCNEIISACDNFVGCFLSLTFTSCLGGKDYNAAQAAKIRIPRPEVIEIYTPEERNHLNYLLLFLGTIAVIVATFFVSYVADHVIHPAPPTQPILPEPDRDFPGEHNEGGNAVAAYTSSTSSSSSSFSTYSSSVNSEDEARKGRRRAPAGTPSAFPSSGALWTESGVEEQRQRDHFFVGSPMEEEGNHTLSVTSPLSMPFHPTRAFTDDHRSREGSRRVSVSPTRAPTGTFDMVGPATNSPVETPPRSFSFSAPKTPEHLHLSPAVLAPEPVELNMYNS